MIAMDNKANQGQGDSDNGSSGTTSGKTGGTTSGSANRERSNGGSTGAAERRLVQISVGGPGAFSYTDRDRHTAGIRWPEYKRDFDIFLGAGGIVDDQQKKDLLLWHGGRALRTVYFSKSKKPADEGYEQTCKMLETRFKSMLNKDAAIFEFRKMQQQDNEAIEDFVARLREAAIGCEFG